METRTGELPDENISDFLACIDSVVNGDDWLLTRQRGRYKAVGAYRDVEDAGLPRNIAREKCVIVRTLDEDIVSVVPFASAEELTRFQ